MADTEHAEHPDPDSHWTEAVCVALVLRPGFETPG